MPKHRIAKLKTFLKRTPADAFLVSPGPNVRYLSGFTGLECWLLITPRKNIFIGDFRYKLQAKKELKNRFEILMIKTTFNALWADLLRRENIRSVCFESKMVSVAGYTKLKMTSGRKVRFIATSDVIEQQRLIKSTSEIKIIQQAVNITKKSLRALKPFVKIGQTELFLKNKLEQILKSNGATKTAFDIIVASGPNAAMPHAVTSQRRIKANEPIIVDAGCSFRGYKSDLTRTFFSGKITQYTKYYKLLAAAQDRAIKLIKPNVSIFAIDRAAREVLKTAGIDKYFGHALGHGVGLQVHEAPSISQHNKQRLKPGMVFTIEPGIYIPGSGGLRIEDMVVVTQKGYKIL